MFVNNLFIIAYNNSQKLQLQPLKKKHGRLHRSESLVAALHWATAATGSGSGPAQDAGSAAIAAANETNKYTILYNQSVLYISKFKH